MLKSLRTLGITFWTACLLTISFQAATWLVTASWPSLTLLRVFGWDTATSARSISFEYMLKALYVFATTELALAFWWLGVACFVLAAAWRICRK